MFKGFLAACVGTFVFLAAMLAASDTPLSHQGRAVRVRLPDWARSPVCQTVRGGQAIGEQTGPDLSFECPARNDIVRCDGDAIEPRDVALAEVCRLGSLPLAPGSATRLDSAWPLDVRVEWIEVSPDRTAEVLASRQIGYGLGLRLNVHNVERRFLRFFRLGASPLTISAREFFGRNVVSLPSPVLGGELLIGVEQAPVRPAVIRLQGPADVILPIGERLYSSLPGLRPGQYDALPVYEGGIRGAPVSVSIKQATSTTLYLPSREVGGVRIETSREQCRSSSSLRLDRVPATGRRTTAAEVSPAAACGWRFDGLQPGVYESYLRGPFGSQGRVRFEIRSQLVSSVSIPPPSAQISGQITYNGRPYSDATVTATRGAAIGSRAESTKTDAKGEFVLTLDGPGSYSLNVSGAGGARLIETRTLQVVDGDNVVRWPMTAGTLRIDLSGLSGQSSTRITLQRSGVSINATLPPGISRLERHGLPFGEYEIVAVETGLRPRVSRAVTKVTLDDKTSEHRVSLDMLENDSRLLLLSPGGGEVRGVRVSAHVPLARQLISTGFPAGAQARDPLSLAVFAPGTAIDIRPPSEFVPTCRVVPLNSVLRIVLARGRSVEVRFDRTGIQSISPLLGALAGIPGAECPVPLSLFQATPLPPLEGHSRFRVDGFPVAEGVVWELSVPSPSRQAISGHDTVVLLRLPRPARGGE